MPKPVAVPSSVGRTWKRGSSYSNWFPLCILTMLVVLVTISYFLHSTPKPVPKLEEQTVIGRAWDLSTDNSPSHVVSPTQRTKAVGTEHEVESGKGKGKRNSPEVQDASPEGDFIDPDNNPASKGKVAPSNKPASDPATQVPSGSRSPPDSGLVKSNFTAGARAKFVSELIQACPHMAHP